MFQAAEVPQKVSNKEFEAAVERLRLGLLNAQFDLRRADFPVIIVLSGDDRPACARALKSMHEWMDQRGLETNALHPPAGEDLEYPPFWRYWRRLPRRGHIGVFIGGWEVETFARRVRKNGGNGNGGFERWLEHVRNFEQALADDGALILKYWFHLPKKELQKRLKKARKDPEKLWWLHPEDELICEHYDVVLPMAERMIQKTSAGHAPWTIIGSLDANYRNLTFATHVHDRLIERLRDREGESERRAAGGETGEPPIRIGDRQSVLDAVDLEQSIDKKTYYSERERLDVEIRKLTYEAHERGISSVLVFEGWDAAGKGGVIRRLTYPIDPRIFQVMPVAAPTEEELAHHYLWRFWRRVPRAGRIAIFDRSWYGRVLVERVEGLTRAADWRRAYAEINDFEEQLAEANVLVQKFWLHIDADEQLRRFEARARTEFKKYKLTGEDYRNRERWSAYRDAVDEMVAQTSVEHARWHVVPANSKRFARIRVLETYLEGLRKWL